jgi:hypothetical protein
MRIKMRTKIVLIALSAVVLTSCSGGQNPVKPQIDKGKDAKENITFQIQKIPEMNVPQDTSQRLLPPQSPIDRSKLDLPADFLNRDFLYNSVGFKDKLDLLVGMVAKMENVNGEIRYSVTKDFKNDSSKIYTRFPASGILIEKKYDRRIGASITYLIVSAKVERNAAYQVLIADVSEVTIPDNSINIQALYNAYSTGSSIDSYYLIRGAVTTSILYKDFVRIDANTDFNAAAIKVGATYYTQNSDLKQDWKIGLQLIQVKEFLKGYNHKLTSN